MNARLSRRTLLGGAAATSALALGGCSTFLGHAPARRPGPGTRGFVQRLFDDLTPSRVWDTHVHLVGLGKNDSGCWVHPAYREEFQKRLLFDLYMLACGIQDLENADEEYVRRLAKLAWFANRQGSIVVMGFDYRVREDGTEDKEHSEIHTPNEYLYRVQERYPQVKAAPSIHPYRKDALDRLDEAKAKGAVAVKWLPNAHAIDPALPRLDPYYKKLNDLGLALITHAGEEQAVDSAETQSFGNVLKLRRALDQGVRVVVGHAAGLGKGEDLDAKESERRELASFDLWLRLMGEKQYEDNLFADISAMTQFNRSGRPLRELMKAKELHPRIVNGSDYPLPAINPLVSTRWLEREGYLSRSDRRRCNEVYEVNPLLFDFVVKRSLVWREGGVEHRFSPCVFETAWLFEGHTAKTRPMPKASA